MNTKLHYLSILDWSDHVSIDTLLNIFSETLPNFMAGLEIGKISKKYESHKFLGNIASNFESIKGCDFIECFGSVKSKRDPSSGWSSYLMVSEDNYCNREALLCANPEKISFAKGEEIFSKITDIGSVGYGYGSESNLCEDVVCEVFGITKGYPKSNKEKTASENRSRWFREKLPMGGFPAPKRYFSGMFRDVFEINLINESHIETVKREFGGVSEILSIGRENYLWRVPEGARFFIHKKLAELGKII